jgi:F0F1-type ATP synthase assembly protein I
LKFLNARNIGLFLGLLLIFVFVITFRVLQYNYFFGKGQYFLFSTYTIGIVLGIWHFNLQTKQPQSFKTNFAEGFKIIMPAVLLFVAFHYFYFSWDVSIKETFITENTKALIQQGEKTMPEIKDNEAGLRKVFLPLYIIMPTIFKYLILGALVNAITSGFFSKK